MNLRNYPGITTPRPLHIRDGKVMPPPQQDTSPYGTPEPPPPGNVQPAGSMPSPMAQGIAGSTMMRHLGAAKPSPWGQTEFTMDEPLTIQNGRVMRPQRARTGL